MKKLFQNKILMKIGIIAASALIIFGIIIAIIFIVVKAGHTYYNDSILVSGNTPGNLYNSGLFCEHEGSVYFSNPFDRGYLYRMDPDGKHLKRLAKDNAFSINVYGHYIYYSKNNIKSSDSSSALRGTLYGVIRRNLDGSQSKALTEDISSSISLSGDNILIKHFENEDSHTISSLYSVVLDGKDYHEVIHEEVDPCCVYNGLVYFSGQDKDHYIYSMNPLDGLKKTILAGNFWMPIIDSKTKDLYYIDLDNNYALMKTVIGDLGNRKLVVKERLSSYNVGENYIYFQIDDGNNSKLCRIKRDGSTDYEIVKEGSYENINLTSQYVYFNSVNKSLDVYRTSTDGPVAPEPLAKYWNKGSM